MTTGAQLEPAGSPRTVAAAARQRLKITHFEHLRALRAPRGLLRTGRDGALRSALIRELKVRTVAHFERLRALRTGAQQTLSVSQLLLFQTRTFSAMFEGVFKGAESDDSCTL